MKNKSFLLIAAFVLIPVMAFAQDESAQKKQDPSEVVQEQSGEQDAAQEDADQKETEQKTEPVEFQLAEGSIKMKASGDWERVEPKSGIIEAEFKIVASEGDQNDGRLTIMASGGSIEDNLARWYGQFTQPDGTSSEAVAKVEETKVQELVVHRVDIAGTYLDSMGGPLGPKVERDGYRMLAAIVETRERGNYYLKFYGPAKTVEDHAQAFNDLIESFREDD
jgi:hypothetical protein